MGDGERSWWRQLLDHLFGRRSPSAPVREIEHAELNVTPESAQPDTESAYIVAL